MTGHHPFEAVGLQAVADGDDRAFILAHQEARKWPMRPARCDVADDDERIRPPSEYNEEMRDHPQLEIILEKCLAYRQSNRYPNANLLLRDVEEYLKTGDAGVTVTPSEEDIDRLPEQTPDKLIQDAEAVLRSGQHQRAIAIAKDVVSRWPQMVPGLLVLARAQTAAGQLSDAEATCTKAQQQEPENPDVLETWAEIFKAQGRPSMAATTLARAGKLRQDQAKRRHGRH